MIIKTIKESEMIRDLKLKSIMSKFLLAVLLLSVGLSAFLVNDKYSYAQESLDNSIPYELENYESRLEDSKYMVVDNCDDYEKFEDYYTNWDDAFGPWAVTLKKHYAGKKGTSISALSGSGDYNYKIDFCVANRNVEYSQVVDMLSKYNTKYLFAYKFSDKFVDDNIEYLLDNYTWDYNGYNGIETGKVSYDTLKKHFTGTRDELIDLVYYIYRRGVDPYKISIRENLVRYMPLIYSSEHFTFMHGEIGYRVRFKYENDYRNALNELKNNADIFVAKTCARDVFPIAENSIVITEHFKYILDEEGFVKEKVKTNLIPILREEVAKHEGMDIKVYDDHSLTQSEFVQIIIDNINSDEFDSFYSFVDALCQNTKAETGVWNNIYVSGKNWFMPNYKDHTYNVYSWPNSVLKSDGAKSLATEYDTKDVERDIIISDGITTYNPNRFMVSVSKITEGGVIFPIQIVKNPSIYRLYNSSTGEHLFTSSEGEYNKLSTKGWIKEGKSFSTGAKIGSNAKGVYRVYNPNAKGGDHHYTKSLSEAKKLVKKGWKWDNNGNPIFYSAGEKEVYRLYNKHDGRHHYTPKEQEKDKLVKLGWKDEGIGWSAVE